MLLFVGRVVETNIYIYNYKGYMQSKKANTNNMFKDGAEPICKRQRVYLFVNLYIECYTYTN